MIAFAFASDAALRFDFGTVIGLVFCLPRILFEIDGVVVRQQIWLKIAEMVLILMEPDTSLIVLPG